MKIMPASMPRTILPLLVAWLAAVPLASASLAADTNNTPPEGFTALFNGKDLTGWKGLVGNPKTRAAMSPEELAAAQKKADEKMRAHWQAVDGVLVFDGKGQSLCTARDYRNFELYVDWKIKEKGDSGIYLRGTPQVQIWDTNDGARNRVGSGGLFNNQKHPKDPLVVADNPVGQWNTFYIKMVGQRVTVKLNGKLVVDNVVLENYWERDKPVYESGQIELQNHGNTLYFRNIYLRELPADAESASVTEHDPIALLDGSDLSHWNGKPDGWEIADDGSLRGNKGAGYLWSNEQYGDFILDLEFKMSPNCNSGVFFRTAKVKNPVRTGIEVQVLDSHGKEKVGKHDCGAIYDLVGPWINTAKPAGQWNHLLVVAQDNLLGVTLNGRQVAAMDLDRWTEPGQNPDGSKNKFKTAYREMARTGHLGFQDHGHPVWYRDITIKPL